MVSKPRVTLNKADPSVLGKTVSHEKTKPGKRRLKKDRRKAIDDVTSALRNTTGELFTILKGMRKTASDDELQHEMLGIFKKLVAPAMRLSQKQKLESKNAATEKVKTAKTTEPEAFSEPEIEVPKDQSGWISETEVARLRKIHPVVVLFSPQIPPNTGTVARLCAAMSCELHLIEPLGFVISDKALRRAGLDYWNQLNVGIHKNWESFRALFPDRRVVVVETGEGTSPADFQFERGDVLLFGAETFGVPKEMQAEIFAETRNALVTIPMFHRGVRSLNLANTVSIVVYQAVAQMTQFR